MTAPLVVVAHRDLAALTAGAAARLVTSLTATIAAGGEAHVVLTGGGSGTATLAALADMAERVDWPRVHVWWGDERFLPGGHPDRNETQAREALLDRVDIPASQVHSIPGPDQVPDPEAAARRYAITLAEYAGVGDVPDFDVLMLGVGDDGHVASLFPEHPGVYVDDLAVIGVRGSPKPPPERVSLTFRSIRCAKEVWLIVSGAAKAPAVALAVGGAGHVQIPAAGATGRHRTLWLVDDAAAAGLPAGLSTY